MTPPPLRMVGLMPALMASYLVAAPLAAQEPPEQARAVAIERAVDSLGRQPLWPGYEPLTIPLAVYTGSATWLFRHPAPPEGFRRGEASVPVWSAPGRYPGVSSNSSADVGGTMTATVLADGPRANLLPDELAAVALHEGFHVFQRTRHPGWIGNEGDLLLYPFDDGELLVLRRQESAGLRRALSETDRALRACWARAALAARAARFSRMDSSFVAYERGSELNEGIATYIQLRSRARTVPWPAEEFAATELRQRFYLSGPTLAFLLDDFSPGWQQALEADDTRALDEMLGAALPDAAVAGTTCGLTPGEREAIDARARSDAAQVAADRVSRRRAFDAREGWRVEVLAAEGAPLWPQGFDPLNLARIDGALLHTRFLKLGNDAGMLEAIDGEADLEAITEAAGEHPLFQGVRRVVVLLQGQPELSRDGGRLVLGAPGFSATLQGAADGWQGQTLTIRLSNGR